MNNRPAFPRGPIRKTKIEGPKISDMLLVGIGQGEDPARFKRRQNDARLEWLSERD
jgi:hypothetical protein